MAAILDFGGHFEQFSQVTFFKRKDDITDTYAKIGTYMTKLPSHVTICPLCDVKKTTTSC